MATPKGVDPNQEIRVSTRIEIDRTPDDLHTRRVVAVAVELARRLRLSLDDKVLLAAAERKLHRRPEIANPQAAARLLKDVTGASDVAPSGEVAAISATALKLLDFCCLYDQRIESQAFDSVSFEQVAQELEWLAADGFFPMEFASALASLAQVRLEQLMERAQRLPVFPAVALRTLAAMADEDVSAVTLERLVSTDQVLAGNLLKIANSALYNAERISTLRQAMAYIGLDATRRVLLSSVFQPMFASAPLRTLWRHSLETADLAERIARRHGRINPSEAFLAGLVHDVGRLLLWRMPEAVVSTYVRMLASGCPPVYAEMLLYRDNHATAGAEVLRRWLFPPHIIEAVQLHHQPERGGSEMAALLYVAEVRSDSEEDLPSLARWRSACNRLGITDADVADIAADTRWAGTFLVA